MNKKILLPGILLVLLGCNPTEKSQKNALSYFDLKGYFDKEALRLTQSNPLVTKTVAVNQQTETKQVRMTDWAKELSVFSNADINRNAWKGLFDAKNTGQQFLYTSDHEKVPVKEVLVTKKNGRISAIRILIIYSNILYKSADTLSYYPDSLYQVKKKQQIKLLSEKNYTITGRFK
ncbi:hypothetical protein [Pedobacter nyackensis]|uniref:hypothetical protein n=1 Tax=Pedobacter nyackensis TaxID=475255 RepID=UPI00292F563C|nr:hypothetical protein [Pedobacter nyackensis]